MVRGLLSRCRKKVIGMVYDLCDQVRGQLKLSIFRMKYKYRGEVVGGRWGVGSGRWEVGSG